MPPLETLGRLIAGTVWSIRPPAAKLSVLKRTKTLLVMPPPTRQNAPTVSPQMVPAVKKFALVPSVLVTFLPPVMARRFL
jgi:hypothetical protein